MKKEASFDDWNDVDDFLLVMNERYIKVLHMSGEIIYKTCPFCEILDASNLDVQTPNSCLKCCPVVPNITDKGTPDVLYFINY